MSTATPILGLQPSVLRRIALAILLAAMACVLLFGLLLWFPESADVHPSESIVRSQELKAAQVHLQARLDTNRLEDNSADRMRVTVTNDSAPALTALHFALNAPGFALDQTNLPCKDTNGAPVDPLPAHSSCHFEVALTPAAGSGAYGITAFVEWKREDVPAEATFLLAPVTIDRTWSAAGFARAGHRFASLMKDLALPIIVALLGFYFSRAQNNYEQARIQREETAKVQRIAAEKEQSETREVARLLLTRVMELAREHYLPFVGQTKSILNEAEKIRDHKPDADEQKLFLHLLLLLKRMEVFRLKEGGVFFKRRSGERAMSAAWFLLRWRINEALGEVDLARAVQKIHPNSDYAMLKERFPDLDPPWTRFQNWLKEPLNSGKETGSFFHLMGILDAFQVIASFEADYALKYWYEEDGKVGFRLQSPTLLYRRESWGDLTSAMTSQLSEELLNLYKREVQILQLP